jgi:hypothetical protein
MIARVYERLSPLPTQTLRAALYTCVCTGLLLCKHVYVSLCLCARAYLLKYKCLCVFVDVCMSAVTHALLTIGMGLQLSSATAPTMTTRASCTYVPPSPFSCTIRKRQSVADTYTHACNDGSMCWPYVCTHERVCPSVSVCECLYLSLSVCLSVCVSVVMGMARWGRSSSRQTQCGKPRARLIIITISCRRRQRAWPQRPR